VTESASNGQIARLGQEDCLAKGPICSPFRSATDAKKAGPKPSVFKYPIYQEMPRQEPANSIRTTVNTGAGRSILGENEIPYPSYLEHLEESFENTLKKDLNQ
jgi:hypothetical protein